MVNPIRCNELHQNPKRKLFTLPGHSKTNRSRSVVTYFEFKLGAAEVGPLLLPEVVGLDDEGNVDARRERLLKDL